MNLKKLTDQNLDIHLKELAVAEREILAEIILHIVEVARRKLYLTFGYSSLFDYLTQGIGYANGIDSSLSAAMRVTYVLC